MLTMTMVSMAGMYNGRFSELRRNGLADEPAQVATAQWVTLDGRTFWGYPLMHGNEVVGVNFAPIERSPEHPFPTSAEPAFQGLWNKAVGTPGYVKAEWQAFGKMIGVME